MKLKDWADKQGISYLTAWRWFKAGDPRLANAYQSDSGTIIVPEEPDTSEQSMGTTQSNDVMSAVLKKTVEFSKNNASVEDFAAWILSNFSLKPHTHSEGPKYSRVKPKSEEVQKHFQQFMKPKGEKPKPNMFVTTDPQALDDLMAKSDDLTAQELVEEIHKIGAEGGVSINPTDAPEVAELMKDISSAMTISAVSLPNSVTTYDDVASKYGYDSGGVVEGAVTRSVDLTPQQFNYTGSGNLAFNNVSLNAASDMGSSLQASSSYLVSNNSSLAGAAPAVATSSFVGVAGTFQPTQKELQSSARISTIAEKPKRGRKPSKNLGNK